MPRSVRIVWEEQWGFVLKFNSDVKRILFTCTFIWTSDELNLTSMIYFSQQNLRKTFFNKKWHCNILKWHTWTTCLKNVFYLKLLIFKCKKYIHFKSKIFTYSMLSSVSFLLCTFKFWKALKLGMIFRQISLSSKVRTLGLELEEMAVSHHFQIHPGHLFSLVTFCNLALTGLCLTFRLHFSLLHWLIFSINISILEIFTPLFDSHSLECF